MRIRKAAALLLSTVIFSGCTFASQSSQETVTTQTAQKPTEVHYLENTMPDYGAVNYDEQRAVWLTYIDMAELAADTEEQFTENLTEVFDKLKEVGINTVYLHVRAFADAYYNSDLYPPAAVFPLNAQGKLLYDPLKTAVYLAHEKKLSIHAWINPLRCETKANMERLQGYEPYEWYAEPDIYTEYISSPEGSPFYWLDPAIDEVQEYVAAGVKELCEYDIDGVHIDDYFYPTVDPSFDAETYAECGNGLTLEEWRLENCSRLVRLIYNTVKNADEELLFGVSPQGNISNNYTYMYADVKRWCSEEGFLDYIAPQVYFGYENPVCPFEKTLAQWRELCTSDSVSLVCGLALYKVSGDSAEQEFSESDGFMARQMSDCEKLGCDGVAFYSCGQLLAENDRKLSAERDSIMAMLTK